MKSPDGKTTPIWFKSARIPAFPRPEKGSPTADVCVVGAGISGLTAAYFLAQQHKSVIVLDEGAVGSGQTGRTSAHLASALDDRFSRLEKQHGHAAVELAYHSHAEAIDLIEQIAGEEKIACEFRRLHATLSLGPEESPDFLQEELAAAQRAGVADVKLLKRGGIGGGPCLRFGNQGRFQPLQYLAGLARVSKSRGVRIFTGCRVKDVQGVDEKTGQRARTQLCDDSIIESDSIVVATNTPSPINDWMGIYTKQMSYRSFVVGFAVPRGAIEDALYWDTATPYHYCRLLHGDDGKKSAEDVFLVGGADHKTGQPPEGDPFETLDVWAREKFPKLGKIKTRWSGQVQEPLDGFAFIGRAPTQKQVYVITGDSGMGLTHGTIGGLIVTDLIAGRENPYAKIYDPDRKMLNAAFISENANTLAQYKDLLTGGDVASVREIPKGEGAIMRKGMSKLAVYRDNTGKLHKCSAVCTHLQCIVRWNGVEKTWDCPCHGSRFDAKGSVLMGPAIDDLPKAK